MKSHPPKCFFSLPGRLKAAPKLKHGPHALSLRDFQNFYAPMGEESVLRWPSKVYGDFLVSAKQVTTFYKWQIFDSCMSCDIYYGNLSILAGKNSVEFAVQL